MRTERVSPHHSGSGSGEQTHTKILAQARAWLASQPALNLGTEIVLAQAPTDLWIVDVAYEHDQVTGVSVHSPKVWFLSADHRLAARQLADEVFRTGVPAKLHTSDSDKHRLRPWLLERCQIRREHDLLVMNITKISCPTEGRWALPTDIPQLELYETQYNLERGGSNQTNWAEAIEQKRVAVLERKSQLLSVMKRGGCTATTATIGGTWTFPEHRRKGFSSLLTAFLISQLLKDYRNVHLVVDDDNQPAIGLYEKLGFQQLGKCYFGYLEANS